VTSGRQDIAKDPYAPGARDGGVPDGDPPRGERQPPLGIQLGELVPWIREHPIRGVITLLLAGGAIAALLNPPIEAVPNRLSPGDCIYARTAAAEQKGPGARPIGEANDVEAVVNAGTAVRAACGLSHGHEVSAIMPVGLPGHGSLAPSGPAGSAELSLAPEVSIAPGGGTPTLGTGGPSASFDPATAAAEADRAAIRANVQATCDAVFADYVGHPLTGSAFVTFAVIPSVAQLSTGPQLALCLVARADGQWLTSPARNSHS
jgi:hypothetical protein